jgi:hypothetical protein
MYIAAMRGSVLILADRRPATPEASRIRGANAPGL